MNSQGQVISIQNAYQNHMHRQQGLALCKTLIELIVEIQKHRGCTLAILSGDHFFETQLFSIQREITDILQRFEEQRGEFLNQSEAKQIFREWIGIRRQWHKDSVQENFLLHSNFISELSKHIWHVVERSNQLDISKAQDELLSLSLRDWLQMLETAAQARGLATHISVSQEADRNLESRLKFLRQQMNELNTAFELETSKIEEKYVDAITKSRESAAYDYHYRAFNDALKNHFINKSEHIDADTIYTLGSHVVSASYQILLACIRLIEQALSPELELWIKGAMD